MSVENYEYSLRASAGGTKATLKFLVNGEVQCDLHWSGMGNQAYHYRLYGKLESISDTYGWIHIQRIEDVLQLPAVNIPIEALGTELTYEYVKLARSRFLQHPKDMLWQAARWNEFFDLILFTSQFVMECFDSLKYVIAEGILEETFPENIRAFINDNFIGQLTNLLFGLDKMKFTRIEDIEPSAKSSA